jgi:hypothetical protein
MYDLDPALLQKIKEELVHAATGWNVLRAVDEQGSTEALSYGAATNVNRAALLAVHQRHYRLPRQATTKKTMKEMLNDLFSKEARQADQAVTKKKAEKRRQDVMELRALREQVRTDLLMRC